METVRLEWSEITIGRVEFDTSPRTQLNFEFTGTFMAAGSAAISRDRPHNGDLQALKPPSIRRLAPVTNPAAGPAR
jgi:hypothetical protein